MKYLIASIALFLSCFISSAQTNIHVPASNWLNQTNATNALTQLAKDLNNYSGQALNPRKTFGSLLFGINEPNTVIGTNTFSSTENLFYGTFRGSLLGSGSVLTNADLYAPDIFGGTYSGTVTALTNGSWTGATITGAVHATSGTFADGVFDAASLTNDVDILGDVAFVHTNANSLFFRGDKIGIYDSEADEDVFYMEDGRLFATSLDITTTLRIGTADSGFGGFEQRSSPNRVQLNDGFILKSSVEYPRKDITTLANGNNAGVDPSTNTFLKLSGNTAIANIAGFTGGRDGRMLILKNASAYNIVLLSESGLDAAATNRFSTAEYTIAPGDSTQAIYDSAESRWNVIGR